MLSAPIILAAVKATESCLTLTALFNYSQFENLVTSILDSYSSEVIDLIICGDTKIVNLILGLAGPRSIFPCCYCKTKSEQLSDTRKRNVSMALDAPLRSTSSLFMQSETLNSSSQAKNNYGQGYYDK